MKTITIRMNDQLAKDLAEWAEISGKSQSEVIRDALYRYLLTEEFERLRSRALPYAEKVGILTDENVFRGVS